MVDDDIPSPAAAGMRPWRQVMEAMELELDKFMEKGKLTIGFHLTWGIGAMFPKIKNYGFLCVLYKFLQ